VSAPLTRRRWALDLSAVALLLAVPILGFWPTFGGPAHLVAAVGGLALGMGIAAVGAWLRWGALVVAAVTVAVYFVFGAALALPQTALLGVVPGVESLRQLALGVVTSWKQLLTTVAPVSAADGFLVVPFLMLLVAGVLTTSLALRLRQPGWALIPAAAAVAGEIALGTSQPAAPVVQGVVFAVVAVAWLALRQAWAPTQAAISLGETGAAPRHAGLRRALAGGGIVALAVVVGVVASGFVAPASPRYVLRDVVIPPFDIQDYPSPLQSYRAYVRDDRDTTLFTVSGLPRDARVRLATMDAYSGTVYNVSDSGFGSSSAFGPVRQNMSPDAAGTPATVHVQVGALSGVWLPDVGAVQSVAFDGAHADDLRRTAHYNESTSTGVVTAGLTKGDAYDLRTVVAAQPSDASLGKTPFAPVKMPKQEGVPQAFAAIAAKATADAETPVQQVRALQKFLADGGYFSHGLEGEVRSLAGHGAARISTLLQSEQMVGDDEQYAVAMALLAGELGIPARVVMGFYPDRDRVGDPVYRATGDTLHAWVEVAFRGVGWVSFDPTPPKDRVPTDQTTKPRTEPKPQVLQPPPPDQQPADDPPTVPADRGSKDDKGADLSVLFGILGATGVGILILGILAAPFIAIGILKATRRRRRREAERPVDRISGGWDELVDRAVDFGTPVRGGATRAEDAAAVGTAFAEPRVATLARRADAEVFGPADPTPDDVDEFWRQVDDIVGDMGRDASAFGRLRARFALRSLVAGTRFEEWLPRRRPALPRPGRDVGQNDTVTEGATTPPSRTSGEDAGRQGGRAARRRSGGTP